MPESLVRYAVMGMMVILSTHKDIKILGVLQRAPAACAFASENLYAARTGPSDKEGSRHLVVSPCIGTETQLQSLHCRLGQRAQQCAQLTLHKTSRG